ncbi:thioredoxin [Nanoarchaeota archaeon]
MVKELTEETYEDALGEELPILIDFWAPWCGPCNMLTPVIEELSEEYQGKLNFYKVNTQDNQTLAEKNGIRGIPCLVIFKENKEIGRIVGALPKESLKTKIDEILG